ncbi:MAG: ABC transporter permease [Candidatus Tectomicrobia bacterium]|nr:ABC transporter permease [Candidatus Tectomicrobia bacterium]
MSSERSAIPRALGSEPAAPRPSQGASGPGRPVVLDEAPERGRRFSGIDLLYPAGAVLFLILSWQAVKVAFGVRDYLLPGPWGVFQELVGNWTYLLSNSYVTVFETLAGFFVSILVGVPCAILIVWFRTVEKALMPILLLSQTFPKVAIAPLFVIWLGFGLAPKVFVSFLISFFPIVIAMAGGLRSVETDVLDLAKSMSATTWQQFVKIRIPWALPHLFDGLKVSSALSIVGAVIGEFVGAEKGLGHLIIQANSNMETHLLFASIVILGVVGLVLYLLIIRLEKWALPWHASVRREEMRESA